MLAIFDHCRRRLRDMADLRLLTFVVCYRGPSNVGGNIHAQPPVMPCLVAMTPTVIRARRSVRWEIRANFACCIIQGAGRGRPSSRSS